MTSRSEAKRIASIKEHRYTTIYVDVSEYPQRNDAWRAASRRAATWAGVNYFKHTGVTVHTPETWAWEFRLSTRTDNSKPQEERT